MKNKVLWSLGTTALVALAGVLLIGNKAVLASGAQNGAPAAVEVNIDNFSFGTMTLTVAAGTTVTWVNKDDVPHTVVSTDKPRLFASPPLDTDEKFSYTFSKPGTYAYFCSIHPKMTAKVVVQ
ncbi:MAG TPA: cupredoxin family copper-binding protein [Terriglobia bacterium]|nr:cupredoxin family copper-binding protein [Terriglobia bacterium]